MTMTIQEVSGAEAAPTFSWLPTIPPNLIYLHPMKQNDIEDDEALPSVNFPLARKLFADSTKKVLLNQP